MSACSAASPKQEQSPSTIAKPQAGDGGGSTVATVGVRVALASSFGTSVQG